jgi:hypothetical protein
MSTIKVRIAYDLHRTSMVSIKERYIAIPGMLYRELGRRCPFFGLINDDTSLPSFVSSIDEDQRHQVSHSES